MSAVQSAKEKPLSFGKKLTLAMLSIVLMLIVVEVIAGVMIKHQKKDQVGLVLSPHGPGMQIEGRYISHPFLPFALRPRQ